MKIGPAGGADGALGCSWVRVLQAAPCPVGAGQNPFYGMSVNARLTALGNLDMQPVGNHTRLGRQFRGHAIAKGQKIGQI